MLKDIVAKVLPPETQRSTSAPHKGDPWYTDADRRDEINATSPRARPRWLPWRVRGWLKGGER